MLPTLKKLSAIALLFLYLVSISGAGLSIHNCQGRTSCTLFGVSFNKICKCTHETEAHSSKCCNDKKIVIKNIGDNFSPKESIEVKPIFEQYIHCVYIEYVPYPEIQDFFHSYYNIKAPPDISSNPLYIENRVFLI